MHLRRTASQRARPAFRRSTLHGLLSVLVLSAFLGAGLSAAPSARADDVTDLQSQARTIAEQLNSLEGRVATLGEKFNQAQVRITQLDVETTAIRRRLASARKDESARRADLARYALTAYVGGDDGALPLALDGKQWDLTRREGYLSIAVGDRQQLVDDLLASQRIGDDTLTGLHRAQAEQHELTTQLAAQQREASSLMDQQQALQDRVQGKLAVAVATQQVELAREAQAATQRRLEAKFGVPPGGSTDGQGSSPSPLGHASTTVPTTVGGPTQTSTPVGPPTTRPGGSPPPVTTGPPVTAPPVTVPPVVPPPPPSSGGRGQIAANAALSQIGVRYSWGGGNASGPSVGFGEGAGIKGFDCSGLTLYAWAQAGVGLYHSAQSQYDSSRHLAISQLQVGDLVFYGDSSRSISHVAIYIGGGQVVHAPNSRSLVQVGAVYLWNGYYDWVGAARPG